MDNEKNIYIGKIRILILESKTSMGMKLIPNTHYVNTHQLSQIIVGTY